MLFKKKQADSADAQGVQTLPDPSGTMNLPASATYSNGDSLFAGNVKAQPANVDFGFGNFIAGGHAQEQQAYAPPPVQEPTPLDWTPEPPSAETYEQPLPPPAYEESASVANLPLEMPPPMPPPAMEESFQPLPPPEPVLSEAREADELPPPEALPADAPSMGLDDFAAPAPGIGNFEAPSSKQSVEPFEQFEQAPSLEMPPSSFDEPARMPMPEPIGLVDDFSAPPAAERSGDYWEQVSQGMASDMPEPGVQVPNDPMAGGQFLDNVNDQLYPDPSFNNSPLNDALGGLDDSQTEQVLEEAAGILFPDQFPQEPEVTDAVPDLESTFYATPDVNDFDAIVQSSAPSFDDEQEVPNPDHFLDEAPFASAEDADVQGFDFSAEPVEPISNDMDFSEPPDFGAEPQPVEFTEPISNDMDFSEPPDFGAEPQPVELTEPISNDMDFSEPPDFGTEPQPVEAPVEPQEDSLFGDDNDMFGHPPTLDDLPDPLAGPLPEPQHAYTAAESQAGPSMLFDRVQSPTATQVAEPVLSPVASADPSTWDINNLQILSSCPLDRYRNLLVVQNESVLALMADNGNQNVSVLKVFDMNPFAGSSAFSAVKEGGVGEKEMYLVTVGPWQAIISVDHQGVVLHTELTP